MNTMQLECFLAVTENLNFARAAEQLHITQPAVTHQIVSLEGELGVKLFVRTTRSVSLTQEGWTFLGDAREIIKMTHGARARLKNRVDQQVRRFGIGVHNILELELLPRVLKELTRQMPMVHPDIKVVPFRALQNSLEDESIEALLCFGMEDSSRVPAEYYGLSRAQMACVVSPEHSLAQRSFVTQEDLKTGSMILCEPRENHPVVTRLQSQILSYHRHEELYFAQNPACACTLVRAGIGFALMPDVKPLRTKDLRYVPLKDAPSLPYGIYYKTWKNKPYLKLFINEMKDFIDKEG